MSNRSLFGRSHAIGREIDEFLDKVSESALVTVAMVHHSAYGPRSLDPLG